MSSSRGAVQIATFAGGAVLGAYGGTKGHGRIVRNYQDAMQREADFIREMNETDFRPYVDSSYEEKADLWRRLRRMCCHRERCRDC